jgi:hypothetical protein
VLVSGYRHPLYERVLETAGFEQFEHAHNSTAARSLDGRGARVEVVWRRPEPGVAEPLALWRGA